MNQLAENERRAPYKLDSYLIKKAEAIAQLGVPDCYVADGLEIAQKTFIKWRDTGKADVENGNDQTPEALFYLAIRRAKGRGEIAALARIRKHADEDWRADAWWLSVTSPDRYGKQDRLPVGVLEKINELSTAVGLSTESVIEELAPTEGETIEGERE